MRDYYFEMNSMDNSTYGLADSWVPLSLVLSMDLVTWFLVWDFNYMVSPYTSIPIRVKCNSMVTRHLSKSIYIYEQHLSQQLFSKTWLGYHLFCFSFLFIADKKAFYSKIILEAVCVFKLEVSLKPEPVGTLALSWQTALLLCVLKSGVGYTTLLPSPGFSSRRSLITAFIPSVSTRVSGSQWEIYRFS